MNSLSMLCAEAVVKKEINFNKSDIDIHSYEMIELYKLCDKNWNKVMVHACQKGYLSIAKVITKNNLHGLNNNFIALRWAVKRGHLDIIKHIIKHCPLYGDRIYLLELAAENDYLEIFKYIYKNYNETTKDYSNEINLYLIKAVENDRIEIVKYLIKKIGCNSSSLSGVVIQPPIIDVKLLSIAFKNYYFDIVKYLISAGIEQDNTILTEALKDMILHGNLDMVQYIFEHTILSYEIYSNLLLASKYGHLPIIKYLISIKSDDEINMLRNDNYNILRIAAYNGHLDVIKYCIDKLCIGNEERISVLNTEGQDGPYEALQVAAQNYHFEVVKFIIEENNDQEFIKEMLIAKNNHVLKHVIGSNDLDMFKFIINKIGNIENWVMHYAINYNIYCKDINLIKYIFDTQCANGIIDETIKNGNILITAVKYGCLDIIQSYIYYKNHNTTFNIKNNILLAIKYGHLDVVKYFNETIDISYFIDIRMWDEALIKACKYGHLEIVKYIIKSMGYSLTSSECDIDKVMQIAIEKNHTEIVEYLNSLKI